MIIIYIKKAFAELNWKTESANMKYRTLYDRIFNSEKIFNKLYNIVYLIPKILIVVAFVLEIDLMARIIILAIPSFS